MYHHLSLACYLCCWGLIISGILVDDKSWKTTLVIVGCVMIFIYPIILELIYLVCYKIFRRNPDNEILYHNHIKYHEKIPICYSSDYNITALGLEKLHPFDSTKYKNVYDALENLNLLNDKTKCHEPELIDRNILMDNLNWFYILKLNYSIFISKFIELPLCIVPSEFLRYRLLNPMMRGTQGTIDATCIALEKGWAINLSGGYHHACTEYGGGFCIYPDITLAIRNLRKYHNEKVKRIMIVDLDAHQGNGHERDFLNDGDVFILDAYNPNIYPLDTYAKKGISNEVLIHYDTDDEDYLLTIKINVENSIERFNPNFIIYNAGTDCMAGDPLGNMNLSEKCIIKRDQLLFELAFQNNIPLIMLLSGGYQKRNAIVIADSIKNLSNKFDIIRKELYI